jgi:murein DD-endopeptidase MepM/ murein hydrolase activator NlpD
VNRGKLIALVVSGAIFACAGIAAAPASASPFRVTVKLANGDTAVLTQSTCSAPAGATLLKCEDLAGAQSTQSPGTTQSSAPTSSSTGTTGVGVQTTPTGTSTGTTGTTGTGSTGTVGTDPMPAANEPATGGRPTTQGNSGGSKGDRSKGKDSSSSSGSDSSSGNGTTSDGRGNPTVQPDGQPTLSNPTTTLAIPGPAPIGVPNFVIDRFKIPPFLLPIYKAAEAQYNIPWQILAAVNEIETNYGQNLNVSTAGAVGWMQFLPSTWKTYGTDANGDKRRDPYNPVDAIFSAARYIKAAGGDKDIRKGLFAYNPANWYVESVLLRAKVIGGLPPDLVGSLTQLVEGRFPVAAKARYADQLSQAEATRRVAASQNAAVTETSNPSRNSIDIFSSEGAPVIAVNDGTVVKMGTDEARGRYVVLQDYAGNRYTYTQLGSVVSSYPSPKQPDLSKQQISAELNLPRDPKPTRPASAGSQRTPSGTGARAAGRAPTRASAAPKPSQAQLTVTKERLFANPTRPSAYRNGGRDQVAATTGARDFETYGAYFAKVFGLGRDDVEFKALRPGAQVVAGTVLGKVGVPQQDKAPYISFAIKPTGKGSPSIDPKPILDGWKLLESTAIYRAKGRNPFLGQGSISVGQMLLMTKEQLGRSVLSDPRIDIYQCGRSDIQGGLIEKRPLILLKYLAGSGLRPTVTSLKCGHSKFVAGGGRVSDHWYGRAVDIAAINGIPILGNQQDGGITDVAIRRLLQLQGAVKPSQIISLRTYQGADNTLSMGDHDDHIHAGFSALPGQSTQAGASQATVLKPNQWLKLIDRLGQLPNPTVPVKPSPYSLPDNSSGAPGRGD